MQVTGTADPRDFTTLGEFGCDRDRICRFAAAVQLQDGGVDRLVRRSVKVRVTNEFDDISYRVFAEQHRPEDRLLGGRVIGWGPVRLPCLLIGEGELRNAHLCSPSSAPHTIVMRRSPPLYPGPVTVQPAATRRYGCDGRMSTCTVDNSVHFLRTTGERLRTTWGQSGDGHMNFSELRRM